MLQAGILFAAIVGVTSLFLYYVVIFFERQGG